MAVFIGAIKRMYIVHFLHQRTENVEYEDVIANTEKEAIELATKKHRLTYPKVRFSIVKIEKSPK
jgi:hypothetical protein